MSERFHCNNGVWEEDVRSWDSEEWKESARSFTAEDVIKVEAVDCQVIVFLKDGSEICPDYTYHGSHEQAILQADSWRLMILGDNYGSSQAPRPLKAIQTEYKGFLFRSRLEARWAVFLDSCGADWEYEPEGFDLDGILYLPDFLVHNVAIRNYDNKPTCDIFCEVKGNMTKEDSEKIGRLFEAGYKVLVLGNIPAGKSMRDIIDNEIDQREKCKIGCYPPFGFDSLDGDSYSAIPYCTHKRTFGVSGSDYMYDDKIYGCDDDLTIKAYNAARQARFEHGEQPKVANRF